MASKKSKGWWSQPAFTGNRDRKTGHTRAAKPGESKPKIEKCGACRKPLLKCNCRDVRTFPKPEKDAPKGKPGPTKTDDNGIEWCNACSSRAWKGVCMDVTCSTRK